MHIIDIIKLAVPFEFNDSLSSMETSISASFFDSEDTVAYSGLVSKVNVWDLVDEGGDGHGFYKFVEKHLTKKGDIIYAERFCYLDEEEGWLPLYLKYYGNLRGCFSTILFPANIKELLKHDACVEHHPTRVLIDSVHLDDRPFTLLSYKAPPIDYIPNMVEYVSSSPAHYYRQTDTLDNLACDIKMFPKKYKRSQCTDSLSFTYPNGYIPKDIVNMYRTNEFLLKGPSAKTVLEGMFLELTSSDYSGTFDLIETIAISKFTSFDLTIQFNISESMQQVDDLAYWSNSDGYYIQHIDSAYCSYTNEDILLFVDSIRVILANLSANADAFWNHAIDHVHLIKSYDDLLYMAYFEIDDGKVVEVCSYLLSVPYIMLHNDNMCQ